MPPPIRPSVSESEEESVDSSSESDSSVESRSRDPLHEAITSDIQHSTGKLINNKRKRRASSQPENDHWQNNKQPRTSYDDPDGDEDDYEQDAESPTSTGPTTYVEYSFTAAPLPTAIGRTTAIDLYRQTFPQFEVPTRHNQFLAALGMTPIKRIPATKNFNDKKPQNLAAFFMQAIGDVVPKDKACERCNRSNGAFTGACVVVRTSAALNVTGGACANCWYNRQGSMCTLRHPDRVDRVDRRPTSTTPIPIPQVPPPPPPPLPASATAPIHPSYAAALAARSQPTAPPKQPLPTPLTGQTEIASLLPQARKTAVWEAKYRAMNRPQVIQTYQELLDLQEDLTIRLRAMNRVVLGRLKAASLKAGEGGSAGRS
ncbi:hypothetical protein QBC38DRAFT_428078 [Podospora fimiseda]|uniref:Uncharacterized protein n=1 Tax=Podospora fimiseda TaxID=252190 RepID=A0AAN6YQ31_9PEZI|nr:hypothetical protein QBC38DRAFT_428078 [Podospora fimiseda]